MLQKEYIFDLAKENTISNLKSKKKETIPE
jgi:hypothetical protein